MSDTTTEDQMNEMEENKVYEIGFHVIPSITEEAVREEFEAVKGIIKKQNGSTFISEGTPSIRTLTYSISKTVKAVKTKYSKAYFGWVKFTALPEQISEIKKAIDEMPTIIRYLIISTVQENTMISKHEVTDESEEDNNVDIDVNNNENKKDSSHIVDVDIDKTIDELVVV